MIVDKKIEGYRQRDTDPPKVESEPRNVELEAMLAQRFDGETALILGDWLQRIGHPRGELIAVQHGQHASAAQSILDGAPELLGDLADVPELAQLEWSNGFVRRATLGSSAPPRRVKQILEEKFPELKSYEVMEILVDALLELPSARFLDSIALASVGGELMSGAIRRLSDRAPRTLRSLTVLDTP